MKNLIETRHSDLSIGELCRTIEEGNRPIRRSPHIGNIRPRDLAVMSGLPPGVEVLLVNTVQGDDKVTKPHVVRIGDNEIPLSSRNAARNRVVGAVAISIVSEEASLLPIQPTLGRNIAEYHLEALSHLRLSNRPVTMMEKFNEHPELLMATAEACTGQGSLHRQVGDDGKIVANIRPDLKVSGLYGIHDVSPSRTGALLPLNGMMALDMLLSEAVGSSETLHLGGGDMMSYTNDESKMEQVSAVKARASALLGLRPTRHRYIVQDIRGLAKTVPVASQHELLLNGHLVDLTTHLDSPSGGNDEK